jgi:hypothetical protein
MSVIAYWQLVIERDLLPPCFSADARWSTSRKEGIVFDESVAALSR